MQNLIESGYEVWCGPQRVPGGSKQRGYFAETRNALKDKGPEKTVWAETLNEAILALAAYHDRTENHSPDQACEECGHRSCFPHCTKTLVGTYQMDTQTCKNCGDAIFTMGLYSTRIVTFEKAWHHDSPEGHRDKLVDDAGTFCSMNCLFRYLCSVATDDKQF